MTILEVLTAVKGTLNEIYVSGEDNLDKLLGSIRAVSNCIAFLSAPPAPPAPEPEPKEPEPEEGNDHADPDPE